MLPIKNGSDEQNMYKQHAPYMAFPGLILNLHDARVNALLFSRFLPTKFGTGVCTIMMTNSILRGFRVQTYTYIRHRASGTSGVTARGFSTCYAIELF